MDEFFHVISRGVDKRKIFMDNKDYFRFIHDLYEFNDENWIESSSYNFSRYQQINDPRNRQNPRERKLLVQIHSFCLMPNHYHLLLSPLMENGIATFMRKLNAGYAKYFNIKHERTGALFEGRYKRILLETDAHFKHLPLYIHLNPLDLKFPEWRTINLPNKTIRGALEYLRTYRWSSHLDYLGLENFPSVTYRNLYSKLWKDTADYENHLTTWLESPKISKIKELLTTYEVGN